MSELSAEFKNSNPINIKSGLLSKYNSRVHVNNTGRLYGVTDRNDDFMEIQVATVDKNRKIMMVKKSKVPTQNSVKSSAVSTGTPFVNFQKVCAQWFGVDRTKWKHDFKYLETTDGADYYEVVE